MFNFSRNHPGKNDFCKDVGQALELQLGVKRHLILDYSVRYHSLRTII